MSFSERTEILIGNEQHLTLSKMTVAIYGLGGVGAACAMDLVRAGMGKIIAVDFDDVVDSNLNRLYFGYRSTLGKKKVFVFKDFAQDVNPDVIVDARPAFFSGETAADIIAIEADLHLDCIDTLNPKTNLLCGLMQLRQQHTHVNFASSMGMAGRLDPMQLHFTSFWESHSCPLAREVRTRLRRRKMQDDFMAVWSSESAGPTIPPDTRIGIHPIDPSKEYRRRNTLGSSPFVPQVSGHILASWATRKLLNLI